MTLTPILQRRKRKESPLLDYGCSEPITKHARTERSDGYIRHPNYYKEDGDVVVKVETTLFRVHKDLLIKLEGLFDMLTIEQPSDTPCIDGVPYFDMHSLADPVEMGHLCSVIYEDIALIRDDSDYSWLHWDACFSILAVSCRCVLPTLLPQAIKALKTFFPISDKPNLRRPLVAGIPHKGRHLFKRAFAIQAINAFREFDVPGLLPMAYYQAAQLPLEDVINGVKVGEKHVQLEPSDLRLVLLGREALKASRRNHLFGWMADRVGHGHGSKGCETCDGSSQEDGETCYDFFLRTHLEFHRHGFYDTSPNSIEFLNKPAKQLMFRSLCTYCIQEVERSVYEGQIKAWQEIPRIFGWKDWKEVIDLHVISEAV